MTEAAGGPEVREATYWCRVYRCANHIPRKSVGIPVGWLRLSMGLPEGKAHYITFCSPQCLAATLERHPKEFVFDPRIDRRRIERARERKQPRAAAGQENRPEISPDAPAVTPAVELAAPVIEPAPASVLAPTPRPALACPRCGSTKLVRCFARVWACEICGGQVKQALPGVAP